MKGPLSLSLAPALVLVTSLLLPAVPVPAATPLIDSVSPDICQPCETLSIYGSNFGEAPGRVKTGRATYKPDNNKILAWTDTRVDVKLPAFARWKCPSSRSLALSVLAGPDGQEVSSNEVTITVNKPADACPVIEEVLPGSCAVGEVVSLLGQNFGETPGRIKIGGKTIKPRSPKIIAWTDTQIDFQVPAFKWVCGGSGFPSIRVVAASTGCRSWSNRLSSLRVSAPAGGCPIILATAPSWLRSGETLYLSGQGFGNEEGVIVLREWIDEDFQGFTPAREVHGPGDPTILLWTDTEIRVQLGPLEGWREWNGAMGAYVFVKRGPQGARLKSNTMSIYIPSY